MINTKISRINRVIGQLEGLKNQLEKDTYECDKVIMQLKAIMGGIKSLGKSIAEDDIKKCLDNNVSIKERELRLQKVLETAFY